MQTYNSFRGHSQAAGAFVAPRFWVPTVFDKQQSPKQGLLGVKSLQQPLSPNSLNPCHEVVY